MNKGIVKNVLAVAVLIVILVGFAIYIKSYVSFGTRTAEGISQYYEVIRMDNIADETKNILGKSSLDYALMYSAYDLGKHGGMNSSYSEEGLKFSEDGILYWKSPDGNFDYSNKERQVNNDLLTAYITKFYDNYENKLKFIYVDIGKPKARFLEESNGFVKGEYIAEDGITIFEKEVNSGVMSEGFVESEVKVRYWRLYDGAADFSNKMENEYEMKLIGGLNYFQDHYADSDSCGRVCQTPSPATDEVVKIKTENVIKDIESELNEEWKNEGIKWELSVVNIDVNANAIRSDNSCGTTCCSCC